VEPRPDRHDRLKKEPMITLPQPPDAMLKKLANDFLFALVNRDFGIILGKIDRVHGIWTSEKLVAALNLVTGNRWVSEFMTINKTAAPVLSGDATRYEYQHRLPINGSWSEARMVIRLHQQRGAQYSLEFVGFVK